MERPMLYPAPKELLIHNEHFKLSKNTVIGHDQGSLVPVVGYFKNIIKDIIHTDVKSVDSYREEIQFYYEQSLSNEGYRLIIMPNGIAIHYAKANGAFYAVATLKQLLIQYGDELPCLEIFDEPDFDRRGIMIDISRNRVPKMKTLYHLVDFMADFKLNELQLYIEGFSFAYPSFKEVWKSETPMTPKEVEALDRYCRARFIDLVPNQNSLGHMTKWIQRKEYRELADYEIHQMNKWTSTLNAQDPRSLNLVKRLMDDLLPSFTSNYFNVGLDEPYELGKGKTKALASEIGEGRVYLNYLIEIYKAVKVRGKTMMFWGDIIIKHPELIDELPKDLVALEWGYEGDHPFETNCRHYKDRGVPFYVCPGTSSWGSILGRTDNMMENLRQAAVHGRDNGAIGYLVTDWGDMGHIQPHAVSIPGFLYGAGLSWNVVLDQNKPEHLEEAINRYVYKDTRSVIGKLLLSLGNYYQLDAYQTLNGTKLAQVVMTTFKNDYHKKDIYIEDYIKIDMYLGDLQQQVKNYHLVIDDASPILSEIDVAIDYARHATQRVRYLFNDFTDEEDFLYGMLEDIKAITLKYMENWVYFSRMGGLLASSANMRRIIDEYESILEERYGYIRS